MVRLAMLASLLLLATEAASAAAVVGSRQVDGRPADSTEGGVCLMQLGISRFLDSGLAMLRAKLDEEPANATEHANSTAEEGDIVDAEEVAATPAQVPLAVKVQDTAKDGTETVLVGPAYHLLMELHVPVRLRDLHTGHFGPMRKFLNSLTNELALTGPISVQRLVMLDVRGENKNFSLQSLDLLELNLLSLLGSGNESASGPHEAEETSSDSSSDKQETIFDIEVLPMQHPGDLSPAQLLAGWQAQLADANSKLREGPLAKPLNGATLVRVGPPLAVDGSENHWGNIIKNSAQGHLRGFWSLAACALLAPVLFAQ